MTELFTLIFKLGLTTIALSCASPKPLTPDTGTMAQPLTYGCVAQIEGKSFILQGKLYEVPPGSEPRLINPGEEL